MSDITPEQRLFAAPGHFYSPVGNANENRRYFRSAHYAQQTARIDAMLDLEAMLRLWQAFADQIVNFPFEPDPAFRYYGRNNQFEYFDASILSGMLAYLKPRKIIEIGAGYSSACVFDTCERNSAINLESFTTIDPDLSRIKKLSPPPMAVMIGDFVQSIPIAFFQSLDAGDILFIDSSHVLKTGSDVHYEYLHILPTLKPGVIVHIHDIFYPLEYPKGWAVQENRSWNEVYLVDMMLTHGNSFDVLFFNDAFLTKCAQNLRRPGDMFARFETFATKPMHHINGSLWLRKT